MKLFGSTSRYKLIEHILNSDNYLGHMRDMARKLKIYPHAIRRELIELEKLGVIKSQLEVRNGSVCKDYYRTGDIDFLEGNLKIRIDKK